MKPPLRIAIADHQWTKMEAMQSDCASFANWEVAFECLKTGENVLLERAFNDHSLGISELSLSKFAMLTAQGTCPYIGLPVFIKRAFPHEHLYANAAAGINQAADLNGKRVGCGDPRHTAHVWHRRMLREDFGLLASDIKWVIGHREKCFSAPSDGYDYGPDVEIAWHDSLSNLLEAGEIDAFLLPIPPSCFVNGSDKVRRLLSDPRAAAETSYRSSGIYPILHIVGIRHGLATADPTLPETALASFIRAKALWLNQAKDANTLWLKSLIGDDILPYGLTEDAKRHLEVFLGELWQSGYLARQLRPEELFHPSLMG